MEVSDLKLLNKDILIKPKEVAQSSIIYTKDTRMGDVNTFEAVKVSANCTEVKEGDTIIINFGDHVPSFRIGDSYYAITSEDVVIGIIED